MQPDLHNPIDTMEELEAFRINTLAKKKKIRNTTLVISAIVATLMVLFGLLSGGFQWGSVAGFVFFAGIIILIIHFARTQKTMKEYRRVFRSIVVNRMWQNVDPQVNFE